ncbi:S8 family serine peptidase [Mangrovitalea sediminis]|uniref:S8 family serine peptidase n=1 Tax=Mangrovitalea sediminis TaxID=1982043 RepID=UPI000BE4F481|nr:S8 family serine peptidase [Mangrovitalea sediminis]
MRLISRILPVALCVLGLTGCGGGGSSSSNVTTTHQISGTIHIEANTRVDGDTADQLEAGDFRLVNNTTPQDTASPLILAGFLSDSSGVYPYDTHLSSQGFSYPADPEDKFRLKLITDQVITWQIFPSRASGSTPILASLTLWDDSGNLVTSTSYNSSSSTAPITLKLPGGYGDGNYVIDLQIQQGGPIRYVLTVNTLLQAAALKSSSLEWNQADFVPNQAIVTMKADSSGQVSASSVDSLDVAESSHLGGKAMRVRRIPAGIARALSGNDLAQARQDTVQWIKQLRKDPSVASAEPDYIFQTMASPVTEPLYPQQWNYPLINLPLAWQIEPNAGLGQTVAVLDTGIFAYGSCDSLGNADWHPDLKANVEAGDDEVSVSLDTDNQPGPDNCAIDPGGDSTGGTDYHGTHVAGTIAAVVNGIGVTGVAYDAKILPVRVLGKNGSGTASDLINALSWVDNNHSPRAHVVNMSLGGLGPDTALEAAINQLVADGVVVVAAAGNEATSTPTYPAAFSNVIAVGAVDGGKNLASYSNYGSWVDLVAPGGDATRDANGDGQADVIVSTWADDSSGTAVASYAGMQGTSMATPHVSGIVALMQREAVLKGTPVVNTDRFRQLLELGQLTDDLGAAGRDNVYGYGLIDALKAVDAAANNNIPSILSPEPTLVDFTGSADTQTLDLKPLGDISAITGVSISSGATWLTATPASFSNGLADYQTTLKVDTTQLKLDQGYRTELTVSYFSSGNARSLTVPVIVRLGDNVADRNAGRQFVLLTTLNADGSMKTVKQATAQLSNGVYTFYFDNVPAGQYYLSAGSDLDNDGYICSSGESCAEYPVNGAPQLITVGTTPISVDLTTSYRRPVASQQSLPRPGFSGYARLPEGNSGGTPATRSMNSP